jgi:uncharacterized protein (TIGR04255 family)
MTERVRFRPFTGDPERRVEMTRAPLALVLVQVRWPEHGHLALDFRKLALTFGENLDDYPLFQEISDQGFQLSSEGVEPIRGEAIYQWRSIDDVWVVQLTKTFVSLYCAPHVDYRYAELAERLDQVTGLLHSVLQVQVTDRIGVRYVNRLSEPEFMPELPSIFDQRVLGMAGLEGRHGVQLVNTLSQAIYRVEDVMLHVRSGYLGPGATMDPSIQPLPTQSWVLDLDASQEARLVYSPGQIQAVAGRLADAAYDFFKLILKDEAEQRLDGHS